MWREGDAKRGEENASTFSRSVVEETGAWEGAPPVQQGRRTLCPVQ